MRISQEFFTFVGAKKAAMLNYKVFDRGKGRQWIVMIHGAGGSIDNKQFFNEASLSFLKGV